MLTNGICTNQKLSSKIKRMNIFRTTLIFYVEANGSHNSGQKARTDVN